MNCRACGGDRLTLVFEMDPMPLAGAFAVSREAAIAAERFPIEWHRCRDCGLVNVAPSIPEDRIFGDYSYRASDVPGLVRHHKAFAAWLVDAFPDTRWALDIGCNDGVLLNELPRSWDLCGIDPSDVASQAFHALSFGDDDLRHYLLWDEPWTGEEFDDGVFSLVVSSNTFAHFDGLGDALAGVRRILRGGGHFVVEVHDLDATLATGQWDTIYHEHKAEWSLPSLVAAGAIHGLRAIAHERLPLHGGLLRVTFAKDTPRRPTPPPAPDFRGLRYKYASRAPVGATAAYGAAARATVYLNQVPEPVEFVVDGSPRRHGRFVPGTGTPIVSPDLFDRLASQPARTLITAWNHADDIKAAHPDYRGEWVTAW
jgi:SAM-dependent methyltransferase